jgi:hypothetical protein
MNLSFSVNAHEDMKIMGGSEIYHLGLDPTVVSPGAIWIIETAVGHSCRTEVTVHPFPAQIPILVRGGVDDRGRHPPLHRDGG